MACSAMTRWAFPSRGPAQHGQYFAAGLTASGDLAPLVVAQG